MSIRDDNAALIVEHIFTNYNLKVTAEKVRLVLTAMNNGIMYTDDEILHNSLTGLNEGDYMHLTSEQLEGLIVILENAEDFESISNKTGEVATYSTSTTKFPTIKGIVDWVTAGFQAKLFSGTNIRPVNGNSLLGSANLQIQESTTSMQTLIDSGTIEVTTPGDADNFGITNSLGTMMRRLSWGSVKAAIKTYLDPFYQSTLISGTNLKTLGGVSLLGSGNIDLGVAIPQANKICVNSINGVNATGVVGDLTKPFETLEYVYANVVNTGIVTGTTTTGSIVLTAVSNTTDIQIGQKISGTGIPWGSIVESKTVDTIVLSQKCTASATITVKWLTIYELNLSGSFIATSNWFKEGFYFARNKSVTVSWGAFTLYEINTLQTADYFNDGGFNYNGTTTTSKYFDITLDQNAEFDFTLNHSTLNSVTTGQLFFHSGVWSLNNGRYKIKGQTGIAKFGTVSTTPYYFASKIIVDITYSYGLLGGVIAQANASNLAWNGNIDTPASVLAVSMPESCFNYTGEWINGSISIVGSSKVDFSPRSIVGTTCTLGNVVTTSSITQAVTCTNNVDFYGSCVGGTITFTGVNNRMYGTALYGPTVSGSGVCEVFTQNFTTNSTSVSGTGTLIIRSNRYSGINFAISVASGAKLINYGEIVLDNVYSINIVVNGTLINHNTLTFTQGGFDSIQQNAGSSIINNGTIQATHAVATSALLQKVGGTLELNPVSKLKVGNSKPPIRCTLNTADSKDISMFWTKSNGNGSTYGLYFAFDGSSYMPNDLVGGQLYENTTY